MNKLLTTITLLCFSVAANAETYVCSYDIGTNAVVTVTQTLTRLSNGQGFSGKAQSRINNPDRGAPKITEHRSDLFIILSEDYDRIWLVRANPIDTILANIINKQNGEYIAGGIGTENNGPKQYGSCVTV